MSSIRPIPDASSRLILCFMSVGLAVMMLFVITRVYTKARIIKHKTWDDVTCMLATLGASTDYVATVFLIKGGFGNGASMAQTNRAMIAHYITIVFVPVTLLLTKLSFYILYRQIFQHITHLRRSIQAGAFITATFYIATSVGLFVFLTPGKGQTVITVILPNLEPIKELGLALAVFGVVSDFYILLIPITGLLQLQVEWRRKVGVMLIFLTGLIACTCSIINLHYRLLARRSNDNDRTVKPIALVSVLELFIGISCSCMPAFAATLRLRVLPFYDILKARISSLFSSLRVPKICPAGPTPPPSEVHYDNREGDHHIINVFHSFLVRSEYLEFALVESNGLSDGKIQIENHASNLVGV